MDHVLLEAVAPAWLSRQCRVSVLGADDSHARPREGHQMSALGLSWDVKLLTEAAEVLGCTHRLGQVRNVYVCFSELYTQRGAQTHDPRSKVTGSTD